MTDELLIYEGKRSKVYRIDRPDAGGQVLLKVLKLEFPSPADIERFYNEAELLEGVEHEGVRKVLGRTKVKNRHALELEFFDGQKLSVAFQQRPKDFREFLYIAISIVDAVSGIHQHNIIHKSLHPENILVDMANRKVKIIDFSLASRYDLKQHYLGNPSQLEGNLSYCSPEQTGRMNRRIDHRSDLYSLGVILYELLAGRPPFQGNDPLHLVHCHIAQTPPDIAALNPNVPRPLVKIIERLLAKNAEDRYQSAQGLLHDLRLCLEQLETRARIDEFELAQRDFSGRFQLPQKLYGREKEIDQLLSAFERSANGGHEFVLVAGYSGTGKSALVHEVHKPITSKNGFFIEGKFDQFQRALPHFAFIQAFSEWVDILLTEDAVQLNKWKQKLHSALGEEASVLVQAIPKLGQILELDQEAVELSGEEARNRFNYLMRLFVQACASEERPLVIFIDDLQWADSASLDLMRNLLSDPNSTHLMLIGAYRDNEVDESHPFNICLRELSEQGFEPYLLQIGNLSEADVNQLTADALDLDSTQTDALSHLIIEKTGGNAFFTTQFLSSLYEDELLIFDYDRYQWTWDLDRIKAKNITDNVVELMADKAKRLDGTVRELLMRAASIGNVFDLNLLCLISEEKEVNVLTKTLEPALLDGLIVPLGQQRYKFSHDRIQQAVYTLIPDPDRKNYHYEIGNHLLQGVDDKELDERLFDIVNQLNYGIELIESGDQKVELAKLNLRAGHKAKENAAFVQAYEYLEKGIKLIEDRHWESQYELSLKLHQQITETAYLSGRFDEMDRYFQIVLRRATSTLDKVKAYETRILAYKAENKLIEAIDTGLELLKGLGEKFPSKPNPLHIVQNLLKTEWMLRGKDPEQLLHLPEMKDARKLAAIRIIADIMSSIYWAKPDLLPLAVLRMIQLSLKYGNTSVSAFAYGAFGVINIAVLGKIDRGYDLGKLAMAVLDRFNAKEWKAQAYNTTYGLILYYREHVKETLGPLRDSYHLGLETGAIEFACVNTNLYCINSFLCGKQLHNLEEETKNFSQAYKQFKQETNFNYNEVYRQSMLNFMGCSEDPLKLIGEAYDEDVMVIQNEERNDKTGAFFIHFNKLMLATFFNENALAASEAEKARSLLDAVMAKFEIPAHHTYEAISLLQLYPESNRAERRRINKRVKANLKILTKWAKHAPENFLHRQLMIQAEFERVKGHEEQARLNYDKAIEAAAKSEYQHEEALAFELASRFYEGRGYMDLAEFYIKAAYSAYREWGAKAKLEQMEKGHAKQLSSLLNENKNEGSDIVGQGLDVSTILKASTALSGQVVLADLLRLMMDIAIENAGADRGLLILEHEGQAYIEAQGRLGQEQVEVLEHIPAIESNLLADSVLTYVRNTKEPMVLHDALNDERFNSDIYIQKEKPRSVLCVPIINQGRFLGTLYMENSLTTDAFTKDRTELLGMLSGQIAVSIENAQLYEQLEQKVEERTAQLADEIKKSDELLYNILPYETAQELKSKGKSEAREYKQVSVLFTDFVDFTETAAQMHPEMLVEEIDACFKAFDQILDKHNVEKIKTIGDAYMGAGGLPIPNTTNALDVVRSAIEIRDFMLDRQKKKPKTTFGIRIGIHSGPVVAGIVGLRKFQYDIWGDTVNTASRLETAAETGKVNISSETYEQVKDQIECSSRGEIPGKGKGMIHMYYANALKENPVPHGNDN